MSRYDKTSVFLHITMPVKDLIKEVFLLLGLAVITALTVNHFNPGGISLMGDWNVSQCEEADESSENILLQDFEIRDAFRAKEIFDDGKAVFVDARAREFYLNGHIKGAISLSLDQFQTSIAEFKKKYPISTYIVAYCYGRECNDSQELARHLSENGYTRVSIFTDGYTAWEREGYPLE